MFNAQRPRSPTLQIPCHTDLTDLTDSSTTDLNINQNPFSFNQNHSSTPSFRPQSRNLIRSRIKSAMRATGNCLAVSG